MHVISRRKFVFEWSTAAVAVALTPAGLALTETKSRATQAGDSLNYEAFSGQIDTRFRVRLPSGRAVNLKLKKARVSSPARVPPSRRPPPDERNEKFSLIFIGPISDPLDSAIHSFEHGRLGRFEMHLGEIGSRDNGFIRYEAVFNQPVALTRRQVS